MHHVGTITKTSKTRPFHAQCVCGPSGDFASLQEATGYLQAHFAKLGGISTSELVDHSDKTVEEQPVPPLPLPHIGGIGTLPASHATQPVAEAPKPNLPATSQMPADQTAEQLEHDGPAKAVTPEFPEAK
jgi:hypothetical protein